MYGWDCFDAIPIDWRLTSVFPTCEHEGEEFVYSEDLWPTHGPCPFRQRSHPALQDRPPDDRPLVRTADLRRLPGRPH